MNKILLTSVAVLLLSVSQCLIAEEVSLPVRLSGTYLQLWNEHGEWNEDDWKRLFDYFQALELSRLVIQWSSYDGRAFFPSETYEMVTHPPLETILRIADEVGMKVLVGLAHDSSFWDKIDREPDLLDVYLQRVREQSLNVARESKAIVDQHPSFEGWYVPQEIDDVHWLEPARRKVLFDYARKLSTQLRDLTPEARLAVSGFSNAHADPEALGRFWSQLVSTGNVDAVLFQDGIGVQKLTLRHLPLYLEALKKAVEREDRDFWVVVENFRQIEGPPINDKPFKAVPASIGRLTRQLEVAGRHSSGEIIAFTVPEYMTPLGGVEAEGLYEVYRSRLSK